jgi:tetratricopeptide (TPR) repeat protein
MQPYSEVLSKEKLTPQNEDLVIGGFRYRAEIGEGQGWVLETGPEGSRKYPMAHALGEKNVFYFLTPLEKGRLQTLLLAYDLNRKEWIDMAGSGVRHFPGEPRPDAPFHWKEWPCTFNTACYGCHVTQLSTNYDPDSDAYHTTWGEPGINCETCHGPSSEHNAIARATPKGQGALGVAPDNAAAHFNMGLLKAEQNDSRQAEHHLKSALQIDPQMAQAAYNLCILLSGDRVDEAGGFCRQASLLRPEDPKYAYTFAYCLYQRGEAAEAVATLMTIVEKHAEYRDAQVLLREILSSNPKP